MTEDANPFALKRRPRVPLRIVIALAEGLGALIGLLVLVICLFGIRIASAPLEVDFLTPAFTASLTKLVDPLTVSIAGTSIRWRGLHATLDLSAQNIRLSDASGKPVLSIPNLAVSLDMRGLLVGRIAPTEIAITDANIRLIRKQDKSIDVVASTMPGQGLAAQPDSAVPDPVPIQPFVQSFRSAIANQDSNGSFAHLRRVSITVGELVLDDLNTGKTWRGDHGAVALQRVPTGINATAALNLALATPLSISVDAHIDPGATLVTATAHASEFVPHDLEDFVPALAGVSVPVAGIVGFKFDLAAQRPLSVNTTLHFKSGTIMDPRLAGGRLPIAGGDLIASYDFIKGKLDLPVFAMDLGGPKIQLSGAVTALEPDMIFGNPAAQDMAAINTSVEVQNLPLARFNELWPPNVGEGARDWITNNLTVGSVDKLNATAAFTFAPGAKSPLTMGKADGTISLSNVTVNYLPGLPKITGATLTGVISDRQLAFTIGSGMLLGLSMPDGSIVLDQFDAPLQRTTIDVSLRGPVRDVMTVLNAPRLGYATKVGIDPKQLGGSLDGSLHFRFSLKKDLPFAEVEYGAKGKLTDLSMPHVALDHDLSEGDVELSLDPQKINLTGSARLGGFPMKVNWTQRLSGNDGPISRVIAKMRLDDTARQTLGLDPIPDITHGPANADVDYMQVDDHHATVKVALDLTDADLTIDWAGWEKARGAAARSSFTLALTDDVVTHVAELHVDSPDLVATGSLDLDGPLLRHANIDHLVQGKTDIGGTVDRRNAGAPWEIKLNGAALDVEKILKQTNEPPTDPSDPGANLVLDIGTDRLIMAENRSIQKVVFKGVQSAHMMQSGTLTGLVSKTGKLDIRLDPVTSGGQFKVETTDFGAFFHVIGVTEDIADGTLIVTGKSKMEGDARRFTAHAEGADYRVLHMPFITRLLSLASFQSVGSLLTGQGIPFTALKADLSFRQGRLDVSHARAYGGAIGLNADGWFDVNAGTLSLEGTLIPAYMLNSLIGRLPLIGNLLVGGEGEGLFDANIRIGGKTAEPNVTVNPLSTFAPGVLRDLFLFEAPVPAQTPVDKPLQPAK